MTYMDEGAEEKITQIAYILLLFFSLLLFDELAVIAGAHYFEHTQCPDVAFNI